MSAPDSSLIVLVHGAWHGAWCWATLQAELDSRGIPSFAVDLPGHGASVEPLGDLQADAALITALLRRLNRPVVLVGHSYGGAVITQAAAGSDNVTHLVYLTAFVPDEGDSVSALLRSMPPAETLLAKARVNGDGVSTIDPELAHDVFYGRCDPTATRAHVARLCPQPTATFSQSVTAAAWKTIPSTYVRCTADEALHITHQDLMAAHCTNVVTLDTDHSPFGSMPVETAEILARIIRD